MKFASAVGRVRNLWPEDAEKLCCSFLLYICLWCQLVGLMPIEIDLVSENQVLAPGPELSG